MSDLSDNEFFPPNNVEDDNIEDENLDEQITHKRKRGKGAKNIFVKRFEKAADAVAWAEKEWNKGLTKHGKFGKKVFTNTQNSNAGLSLFTLFARLL